MKELLSLAGGLAFGYLLVTKVAPSIQAWIESQDIDHDWAFWNGADT